MEGHVFTTWRTVRVFISSTFRDMQAERDCLVREVFPKLREELVKYRIHVVDVDLRWGVTSDQDTIGVCRGVIDECHPRFMCMLGERYGWVPQGHDKSITADEVNYGVLGREKDKRGCAFFYFRDDRATACMVEKVPGDFREPPGSESAQKLAVLKESITAELPVFVYEARWDAAQNRLTGLEAFGNQVYTDLLQSLKGDPDLAKRFTDGVDMETDQFGRECAEEAEQTNAFIEERSKPGEFVLGSREPLMCDLLAFATAKGNPHIFVITGEPGSGKTAFLAKFTRDLFDLDSALFILPAFIGAGTGSTDLRRTLRRLCHEIALVVGNIEPVPLDLKEIIARFQELLAKAAGARRVILVFDALDQLESKDGAHRLNWLPAKLPKNVRIVTSVIAPVKGKTEHQSLAILRARSDTRIRKLNALTEEDTRVMIEGYLRRYAKRLYPEQLAALQAKPAGHLPLYVLTALEELRTLGTSEEIAARISELPGETVALFEWILSNRLAHDPIFGQSDGEPQGQEFVNKFAVCLSVCRHGLSPAELTALLDPDDRWGRVATLLRLLRPYLMRRGELLDFYHGQFREAAVAQYLVTPNGELDLQKWRDAHLLVADCLQTFADPHGDGQCRDASAHALSELPYHLTGAEVWPKLTATLENIHFLEAKIARGMLFDLPEDFTIAVAALPPGYVEGQRLGLLLEALRRDIHFIARHTRNYPQALFQCLWNSGWWYDCPEAASHHLAPENGRNAPLPESVPAVSLKLSTLLERWRIQREASHPGFCWIRALRPPQPGLGAGQMAVLSGHEGWIGSVAFSPDGRLALSGSNDHTVRLWDLQSGQERAVLRGHVESVATAVFSPDGTRILSGSEDGTIRMWETQSGLELAIVIKDLGCITSLGFSRDGRRLVCESFKLNARLWDAQSGRELAALSERKSPICAVAFSPDGKQVITGSADNAVRLWNAESGQELAVFRGHTEPVFCVAFSPDGRYLATGSRDETVRLWDTQSGWVRTILFGRTGAVLRGHEAVVHCVAFSRDGRLVASGSDDQTIRLWDVRSGCQLAVLRGHKGSVRSLDFSQDGRLISGATDLTARLWDAKIGQPAALLRGHTSWVSAVEFSADGEFVASGSFDTTVRLWDVKSGCERVVLRGHTTAVTNIAFSPDGQRMLSGSASLGDPLLMRETDNWLEVALPKRLGSDVKCAAFSPNSRLVVSGSTDRTVRLWDVQDGELAILWGHEDWVTGVTFSHDGRFVASGARDGTVRVWDVQNRKALMVLRGHDSNVTQLAFSPDGRGLASQSKDNTIRIWDVERGKCLEILSGVGDVAAIMAGAASFPWRAMVRDGETVFESVTGGRPLAWHSDALDFVTTHRSGRLWAGAVSSHVILTRIEGDRPV